MSRHTALAFSLGIVGLSACCFGWNSKKPKEAEQQVVEAPKKEEPKGKPVEFKPEPEKPKFLVFGQPTVLDGIKVEILSGSVGPITMQLNSSRTTFKTKESYFQVRLRVSNETETFLLTYMPWHSDRSLAANRSASVTDEFDNRYLPWRDVGFSTKPVGDFAPVGRVDPGKSIVDTVAFEMPIAKANDFTIRLPGHAVGRPDSVVVYKLPRSFFEAK